MITFTEYYSEIDEGFFDSLKKGFSGAYQQANTTTNNNNDLEKYAKMAMPAIQKAHTVANEWAKKFGVSPQLATALVASGIIGGPAAVPFAALMYFIRKPLNKVSGAAFDKGAQMVGAMPNKKQVELSWHNPLSFHDYVSYKEFNEGFFGDKIKQFGGVVNKGEEWLGKKGQQAKQWWDTKGADQVGHAIGKASGFIAGKTSKYAKNVANLIKNSSAALLQFVKENKLSVAKAAFMMSIGALVGSGVGASVNALTSSPDTVANVMHGLEDSNVVPEPEIAELNKHIQSVEKNLSDLEDKINSLSKSTNDYLTADQLSDQPHQSSKNVLGQSKQWKPDTAGQLPAGQYTRNHGVLTNTETGQQFDKYNNPVGGTYGKGGSSWTSGNAKNFIPK